MNPEEFREHFTQLNNERFYARPIFNDELMGNLSELLGKDKYQKFDELIENDDIDGLEKFLTDNYNITNKTKNLPFYQKKLSLEFDLRLEYKIESDHPYYLGFYSDGVPLYLIIEILRIYFKNPKPNHWLTGIINPKIDNKKSSDDSLEINGHLMFAASPVLENDVTFHIQDTTEHVNEEDDLTNYFLKHKSEYLNKLNNTIIDEKIPASVNCICCYNIGQGNCIKLNGSNNEKIYFDVGLTRYKAEKNQKEIKNAIDELEHHFPDIIILSHWDTDHILGLSLWDDNVYTKRWIIPDLHSLWFKIDNTIERKANRVSSYAFRIFLELIKPEHKNVHIINEELIQTRILNKEDNNFCGIEIWTGQRKSSNGITRANNFGLIMVVKSSAHRTILCGDCDYEIIPEQLKNSNYDYVIVSHHGSKRGCE